MSVPCWLAGIGIFSHCPSNLHMYACVIYSYMFHNFVSTHPKCKLTVCIYACVSEPVRRNHLEKLYYSRDCCAQPSFSPVDTFGLGAM